MNENTFTEEQWDVIAEAPQLAGLAVTVLDFGVVSAVKESAAVVRAIENAANGSDSPLLSAIAARLDKAQEAGTVEVSGDRDDVLNNMLGKIEIAVNHVSSAGFAPETACYKKLLVEVAEAAAGASGSGLFGLGEKVSEEERTYLDRLRQLVA